MKDINKAVVDEGSRNLLAECRSKPSVCKLANFKKQPGREKYVNLTKENRRPKVILRMG